jgi:Transaldolase/Fructose-6-phosphate aldolase
LHDRPQHTSPRGWAPLELRVLAIRPNPQPEREKGQQMFASTPIRELARHGQSLWLDNLSRNLIRSGELERLRDMGVSGITSNPTIFDKAIRGSNDYRSAVADLANSGRDPEQMLWDVMVQDVQAAADVFRPVYDSTAGADGFMSMFAVLARHPAAAWRIRPEASVDR